MLGIPGAIAQHAFESRACGFEFVDRLAIQGFHGDAVAGGVEHHLLVGASERGEHDVLVNSVHREDLVERFVRRPALHRPDRPADRDINLEGAQTIPQIVPPGGGDSQI